MASTVTKKALTGLPAAAVSRDRWRRIGTLIWARLLVASLALPVGLVLGADTSEESWRLLGAALLAVGLLSVVFRVAAALQRGYLVQIYSHLAADVALVTLLAAVTGARESQFVLFYVLVTLAGGAQAGLIGGLSTAAASCVAYLVLPGIAAALPVRSDALGMAASLNPGMLLALLAMLGVLAGLLGRGVQSTRADLVRASRELDRVRFDNDVILRHLTSGVITVERSGVVSYLNPAAEEVLELRLVDVVGRPLSSALVERLKPLRDTLEEVLKSNRSRLRGEVLMRTTAGRELPIGVSTNALTHEGEVTGVVAIFTDLSEVREMEQRARRNQTLAELGALAAGIAHELRNGLNPISGSVECLQRELKLEGENAQLMELIGTECARLNRFVTDLLAYSKERTLAREAIPLEENLAELCEELKRDPRRRRNATVRFEAGEVPLQVQADREQLRQVWLNLAVNALEAIGDRGTLTVRCRTADDGQVTVEFVDDGNGIVAEDLPRIAQPFFTTKQGGTGLGLAIAQRIVERHGGSLAFESTPGRGTVARVTLPGEVLSAAQAA